jgi:hypothetical protein
VHVALTNFIEKPPAVQLFKNFPTSYGTRKFAHACYVHYQVEEDEMGKAYNTNGGRRGYGWESQKERDHQEDQDVGGWIILKWILER